MLTAVEARVLYTMSHKSSVPPAYYDVFRSALRKVEQASGGTVCCRDCTEPGRYASRLGGFTCADHKPRSEE